MPTSKNISAVHRLIDLKMFFMGAEVGQMELVHFKSTKRIFDVLMPKSVFEKFCNEGRLNELAEKYKGLHFIEVYFVMNTTFRWWFKPIEVMFTYNEFVVRNFIGPGRIGPRGYIELDVDPRISQLLYKSEHGRRVFQAIPTWFALEHKVRTWRTMFRIWRERRKNRKKMTSTTPEMLDGVHVKDKAVN